MNIEPVSPSTKLLRLAADMVTGEGIPSHYDEDHPRRRTRAYWLKQLELANSQALSWGNQLSEIQKQLGKTDKP